MSDEIFFESLSNRGSFYKVDVSEVSCSCKYFQITLKKYPADDPRRLCKHLIQAFMEKGLPDQLEHFKDEIKKRALLGQSFIPSKSSLKDLVSPLPLGSIETITANKKIKYAYLTGMGDGRPISVSIKLEDKDFTLKVDNQWASGSLRKNKCVLPKRHRYMEAALLDWISSELRKL